MIKIYLEIAIYFLKLGTLGFGGPLAIIAYIQRDLVTKRQWISHEHFQKVLPLIKAMPGTVAFMTAVYFGRQRGGRIGGALAGFCLVLPAFLLMLLFGYYHDLYSQIKWLEAFLLGMQGAALALIFMALKSLAQPYLKKSLFWVIGFLIAVLFYNEVLPEPILILGSGLLMALYSLWQTKQKSVFSIIPLALPALAPMTTSKVAAAAAASGSNVLVDLTLVCFKAGAIVFGTGLAIVPFLEKDFVENLQWLTHGEFMEALALGQVTPGPVVITATFIGFRVAGFIGATLATIAMFLPCFFHVMTWFPSAVNWLSKQKWLSSFLLGATAAVAGSIAVTLIRIGEPWQIQPFQFVIVGLSLWICLKTKLPSWAVIVFGGLMSVTKFFAGF